MLAAVIVRHRVRRRRLVETLELRTDNREQVRTKYQAMVQRARASDCDAAAGAEAERSGVAAAAACSDHARTSASKGALRTFPRIWLMPCPR